MRPPQPMSFDSTFQPRRNVKNGSNAMSYPSYAPPIDFVQPVSGANAFPEAPVAAPRRPAGPRAIGFDDPDTLLPEANLDRSNRTMPHDFLAPGLFDPAQSKKGADYSEIQHELLDQQQNRIRGSIVKEDEIENQDKISDIFFHTVFGNVEGVKRAVEEYGASVNQFDSSGYSPLHYACRRPAILIVKYLVGEGAQINCIAQNQGRDSPLCCAAQGGDLEIVHLLINQGADINYRNGMMLCPLHLAIKENKKIVAVYLINNGSDIELTDMEGHTSLHWACYRGQLKVLETLIRAGGNVLAADKNGMLPLHWTAVHGHIDCMEVLIQEDPTALQIPTNEGLLPIDMARKYEKAEAEDVLASHQGIAKRSRSYTLKDFFRDLFAPSARPFMLASVVVPLLLLSIAYLPWPRNVFAISVVLLVYWILVSLSKEQNSSMMGIGLWSHFYTNLIYFAYILPVTYHLWYFQIPFFVLNVIIYEWYRQLAYDDPGYIDPSRGDILRMVEDMKNGAGMDRYCPTCWIYKPYRSKHCKHCNRCVLKMDHHCPFTGNCVGASNHWLFYISHACYLLAELGWLWLSHQFGVTLGYGDDSTTYWDMFWLLMENEPCLWAMNLWHMFHFSWMSLLFVQQSYQVINNITTNEIWNYKRYEYMKDPNTGVFKNPYDHGIIENFKEEFFASKQEILRRTSEFPTQQDPMDKISLLPTKARYNDTSKFNKNY